MVYIMYPWSVSYLACLPRARMQALVEATGRSMALIKKEVDVSGDIGSVAAASRGQQRTMFAQARLTVAGVCSRDLDLQPIPKTRDSV